MALPLAASDEPNRFCIQLYHRTATQVDLSGKRVLEVGCGHGGGASYLMRTLHPASYTGLDLNPAGIAFCRKRHNLPGLDFVQGDAENLPFADESFDAVINIESSHLYPRFPRFLAEVARVLRPGGHFLYADLRPRVCIAEWEAALADAPMRMLSQRTSTRRFCAEWRRTRSGGWTWSIATCRRFCPAWPALSRRARLGILPGSAKRGVSRTGCTPSPRTEAAFRPDGSPRRRDHQHVAALHQQSCIAHDLATYVF